MASFSIHLAIGKRYSEKNYIDSTYDFYKGIIAPDLSNDKFQSHYSMKTKSQQLLQHLENKVHLEKFLENEEIDSTFQKGVFLHLITDYLFYTHFFDKNYIMNISYQNFCHDLYYSYHHTDHYINTKYQLDYTDFIKDISHNINENNKKHHITYDSGNVILPYSKLDQFIELVSDIDLNDYSATVLHENRNIIPNYYVEKRKEKNRIIKE